MRKILNILVLVLLTLTSGVALSQDHFQGKISYSVKVRGTENKLAEQFMTFHFTVTLSDHIMKLTIDRGLVKKFIGDSELMYDNTTSLFYRIDHDEKKVYYLDMKKPENQRPKDSESDRPLPDFFYTGMSRAICGEACDMYQMETLKDSIPISLWFAPGMKADWEDGLLKEMSDSLSSKISGFPMGIVVNVEKGPVPAILKVMATKLDKSIPDEEDMTLPEEYELIESEKEGFFGFNK